MAISLWGSSLPADDSWQKATNLLASRDYLRALATLKEWGQSEKGSEYSPEYHRNLAKAYWELGQAPDAIYHLAQSARYSVSLFSSYKNASDLEALERELGVRDGLSTRFWFTLLFLAESNWIPVLFSVGLWSLVAILFFAWASENRVRRILRRLVPLPLIILLMGVTPMVGKWFKNRCGVLWGEHEQIAVYKKAARTEQQKLIDLPTGTLVFVADEREGAIQLSEPVGGWVAANEVRWLFR